MISLSLGYSFNYSSGYPIIQFTIPFSHGSINLLFSSSFFRKVVKLEWRKEDIQGLCQAEERVGVVEESH